MTSVECLKHLFNVQFQNEEQIWQRKNVKQSLKRTKSSKIHWHLAVRARTYNTALGALRAVCHKNRNWNTFSHSAEPHVVPIDKVNKRSHLHLPLSVLHLQHLHLGLKSLDTTPKEVYCRILVLKFFNGRVVEIFMSV